jgi:hypothetical protein
VPGAARSRESTRCSYVRDQESRPERAVIRRASVDVGAPHARAQDRWEGRAGVDLEHEVEVRGSRRVLVDAATGLADPFTDDCDDELVAVARR